MSPPEPKSPSDEFSELALRLDELAESFRVARAADPGLSARAFAAQHPEVEAQLLPMLEGMVALDGAARQLERAARAAEGSLSKGARVGPYEIVGVLGRGGMGVVYEAVEAGLGRSVALKAIRASDGNERFRARFLREGRAAAQLDHPCIVPVLGAGADGDLLWYAMRLVRGDSLDGLIAALAHGTEADKRAAREVFEGSASGSGSRARALAQGTHRGSERAAASLALDLARALDEAHSSGVLHRDIKPGNVLVDRDGRGLLTDFGLCKVEGDASLTEDKDVVGTLRYMPPEALRGGYDATGDLYGVGLILYELLALRPAFQADGRHALVDQILHRDQPPLKSLAPGTSGDLLRIVRKASSKLPEERYPSAAALATDLDAFLDGRPVEARDPSALYVARLFVRRNRGLVTLGASALLVVALLTAVYVIQLLGAFRDADAARSSALLATAEATLRTDDLATARLALDDIPEADRGWLWRYFDQRLWTPPTRGPQGMVRRTDLVYLPAVERLIEWGRPNLQVLSGPGFEQIGRVPVKPSTISALPDGSGLLVSVGGKLERVSWGQGDEPSREACGKLPRGIYSIAVLEGSRQVVAARREEWVAAYELADPLGEPIWRHDPMGRVVSIAARGSDGAFLGLDDGRLVEVDEAGAHVIDARHHAGAITSLIATGDELLVSCDRESHVLIHPALAGGAKLRTSFDDEIRGVALSPDRRELAIALSSGQCHLLDPRTARITRSVAITKAVPQGIAWTDQGWLVAADDRQRYLFGTEAHGGRLGLPGAMARVLSVTLRLGASGERLACVVGEDSLTYVHELDTNTVHAFALDERPRHQVDLSPSGEFAVVGRTLIQWRTRAQRRLQLGGAEPYRTFFGPMGDLHALVRNDADGTGALELWRVAAEGLAGDAPRLDGASLAGSIPDLAARDYIPMCMSADRSTIFIGTSTSVVACSLDPFTQLWSLELPSRLCALAFDEERRELLVSADDREIRAISLDDPTSYRQGYLGRGPAFSHQLCDMVIGPEPGQFTTSTNLGRVDVWSTESFDRLGTLAPGLGGRSWLARDPGTGWMLVADFQGGVALHGFGDAPIDSMIASGDVALSARLRRFEEARAFSRAATKHRDDFISDLEESTLVLKVSELPHLKETR